MAEAAVGAPYMPDYAVHPGGTLRETMQLAGMPQTELARRTGLSRKTINGVLNGREPITPDSAIQLENVFRVPARFWLNLQKNYEETSARVRERERLSTHVGWIDEVGLPYAELVGLGAVPDTSDPVDRVSAAFKFFGVAGPQEFASIWGDTAAVYRFRRSETHPPKLGAVAAWLRLGELAAHGVNCLPFSRARLDAALRSIRAEAAGTPEGVHSRIAAPLAECGVALPFVPSVRSVPLVGATRWLSPSRALILMRLREMDDGSFWFTLFHELAHVALHGKRELFLELDHAHADDREREADLWARDRLIPREPYRRFLASRGAGPTPQALPLSPAEIQAFAREVSLPAGVVVVALQKDGWLPHPECNELKVRLAGDETA